MRFLSRYPKLFLIIGVSVWLAACGGGGGGAGSVSFRVVYLADQDTVGVNELYLAGSGTKLNPPLPSGSRVTQFRVTPDNTAVVYEADQDTAGVFELYRVPFTTPGVSTKLNPAVFTNATENLIQFQVTPDGTAVVYGADQDTDGVRELYRVAFATPGVSTKLNPSVFTTAMFLRNFQVTPDSTAVVYLADQDIDEAFELYRVDFAAPGVSTKLNGPLVSGGSRVDSFVVTPDSQSVVYKADQDTDQVIELYRVAFATPGASDKLNGPLVSGGVVARDFVVTPDSQSVVYKADQDTDDVIELYRVRFDNAGVSTKLNGTLVGGGDVRASEEFPLAVTPDSLAVVYGADQDTDEVFELYRVDFAAPGVSTKLNAPLATNGRAALIPLVTPDGQALVYLADQDTAGLFELYRVEFATPGASDKLNGPLVGGGLLRNRPLITLDSAAVVYQQETAGVTELYGVPFATPGVSTRLNASLVPGGSVSGMIAY